MCILRHHAKAVVYHHHQPITCLFFHFDHRAVSRADDGRADRSRNIDAAKKARKSIRELDELFETGFRGAEADLVISLVEELDAIENDTDEMQAQLRTKLFKIEKDMSPVDVMFLYQVIELVGDIGDVAERIGRRLELLLSH